MRTRFAWLGGVALVVACSGNGAVTYQMPPPNPEAGVPDANVGGLGVGAACDTAHACRAGLACNAGKCTPAHSTANGGACVIDDECATGSACVGQKCVPGTASVDAGTGAIGSGCKTDADCQPGERCDLVGIGLECVPEGTADVGGACMSTADCLGGLSCIDKTCQPNPPPGAPPVWPGAICADDPGATEAYFRVPRGTNDGDFYRLPMPNDVRTKNGHPDFSGHPTPGSGLLGFDAVDRYLRDVEQNTDGFSAYPTVIFRFSNGVSFDSLKLGGAIRWFDVTQAPAQELGYGWTATTARDAYLCANPLKIRPPTGAPLVSGHTYAVVLSTQIVDAGNQPIKVSADLQALVAATPPSGDAALAAAYPAYKPLRDLAAALPMPTSSILDATVFTVGHATRPASMTAQAVAKLTAPTATNWVKCDGTTLSPCAQATGNRACPAAPDPAFDELHALLTLPVFQQGNEPYLTPADGGDFAYASDGTPTMQRMEQVCMSLTVPKGVAMPAGGWPLVVYAHGTGGSFRSVVNDGVAARLASVDDGSGNPPAHIAVLGIDQVEHGTRRGMSTASPNDLFFNFANPAAARGNPLQGAADQLSLARFAKSLDLAAGQSPTGAEIKFGAIAYWGHSQGATEGGIALSYDTTYSGAVLSGEGASLIDALLTKTSPVDVADAVPFALQDPAVDVFHPVLTVLQNAIDAADPLNHAVTLAFAPVAPANAKHVFQPFGQEDTYAPVPTEKTFALAAGLGMAAPPSGVTLDPINGSTPLAVPASGNFTVGASKYTAIVREYAPNGYDGHFVSYRDTQAVRDVDLFLADVLAGKVPAIGR